MIQMTSGPVSSAKTKAVLLAFVTAVMWGFSFVSIKISLDAIPPMTLGGVRFAIAIVALGLWYWFQVAKGASRLPAKKDIPRLAISGFIGTTLYFLFENNGVKLLTASEASLVIGTIPVVTLLVERLTRGTRFSVAQVVGVVLSFVGIVLLVLQSLSAELASVDGGIGSVWGYVLMAGAAIAWVVYARATEPLFPAYDRLAVTFWQSVFGFLGFIPFSLAEAQEWRMVDGIVAINVLYLAVFCSALGYLFYVSAIATLGPTIPSVFINLIPVISAIAGALVLGEVLPPLALWGGAVAICGVFLATLAKAKTSGRSSEP